VYDPRHRLEADPVLEDQVGLLAAVQYVLRGAEPAADLIV
jgi:hypothetical protein